MTYIISYLILEDDWATHVTILSPLGKLPFITCPNTTWVSKGPNGSSMMKSHPIGRKPTHTERERERGRERDRTAIRFWVDWDGLRL